MELSGRQMQGCLLRVFFALFVTGFSAQSALFLGYHGSGRPTQPQPELGRVYPSNNHGSVVYLTDEEATGQSLLTVACAVGLFPAGFFVWKLCGYGYNRRELGDDLNTWPHNAVFAGALVFSLSIIFFLGPHLVYFAVSHGWVLSSPWLLTRGGIELLYGGCMGLGPRLRKERDVWVSPDWRESQCGCDGSSAVEDPRAARQQS